MYWIFEKNAYSFRGKRWSRMRFSAFALVLWSDHVWASWKNKVAAIIYKFFIERVQKSVVFP
jgi:hypothetical protein